MTELEEFPWIMESGIRISTAAKLRGVQKSAIQYHVARVRAGLSKQPIRVTEIDGIVFVHKDDVLNLVIQEYKLNKKKAKRNAPKSKLKPKLLKKEELK